MFNKSTQYAIRAVMYLAIHSNKENKSGVDPLANELDVPRHFLAKILQQLSKNNLISSVKGPNGGFYLSSGNLNNKMIDLVKVMEGSQYFEQCILGLPECSSANPCPLHTEIKKYRVNMVNTLEKETIGEFAIRTEKKLSAIKL